MVPALMAASAGMQVAGLGASIMGARASKKASQEAARRLEMARAQASGELNWGLGEAKGSLNPYIQAGQRAMPSYENAIQQRVEPTTNGFSMDNYFNSPGYQFQLQEGESAINRGAAARGNYFAPATMQALSKYGQGVASQNYNEAFQRYLQETGQNFNQRMGGQQQYVNQLAGMYNSGQNAATNLSQYQMQTGQNQANLYYNTGQNQATIAAAQGQYSPWNQIAPFLSNMGGQMMSMGMGK